ncbi:hypothetical protein ACWD6P_35240 [Streptomyces sp. NPDC002446]
MTAPEGMTAREGMPFRADATVRPPAGAPVTLGSWKSYSPGRTLGWLRKRAEQVARQLGAPYDQAVRAWSDDAVEYRWALDRLAAGIPFVVRAVDGQGRTYAFVARPDEDLGRVMRAPLPASGGQGAAWSAK